MTHVEIRRCPVAARRDADDGERESGEHDRAADRTRIRAEALFCRSHPPCSLQAGGPRDRSEPEAGEESSTAIPADLITEGFGPGFNGPLLLVALALVLAPSTDEASRTAAFLARLAALAVERGCGRFEWSVLDWNEPAIRFYRSIGARAMDEWTVYRLAGDAIVRLAGA